MNEQFKPNKMRTKSDVAEERAVECLENILKACPNLQPNFNKRDKFPNIDGQVHFLDAEGRPEGELAVQIKSYTKKTKNPKYPIPTSLLGFAKNHPIHIVIFFAVDYENSKAYWVHINKKFIDDNSQKRNQTTITYNFQESDVIYDLNALEVESEWRSIYDAACCLLNKNFDLSKELTNLIDAYKGKNKLNLEKDDIICIQKFIDEYNSLLHSDFSGLRKILYTNVWKLGIGIDRFEKKN